jgi:hypothetical protein
MNDYADLSQGNNEIHQQYLPAHNFRLPLQEKVQRITNQYEQKQRLKNI